MTSHFGILYREMPGWMLHQPWKSHLAGGGGGGGGIPAHLFSFLKKLWQNYHNGVGVLLSYYHQCTLLSSELTSQKKTPKKNTQLQGAIVFHCPHLWRRPSVFIHSRKQKMLLLTRNNATDLIKVQMIYPEEKYAHSRTPHTNKFLITSNVTLLIKRTGNRLFKE